MKRIVFAASVLLLTVPSIVMEAQRSAGQSTAPRIVGWADDSRFVVQMVEKGIPVVKSVDARRGSERVITDWKSEREMLVASLPGNYLPGVADIVSPDNKSVVITRDNDLYFLSAMTGREVRLTTDPDEEVNTRFSPDSRRIAYTKNKDLYVFDLIEMREIRLTFDAADKIYNGYASWVYFEEILGRPSRYAAFWWAPDGSKIAFLRTDDNPVPIFTLVRLDEADGVNGRTEVTPYPKPGDPNPAVKMGIADIASGSITWVKTNDRIDQYIAWPFWTPDSKRLAIQVLNRDQNDLRIILASAATGDYREIYRETRPTWVEFYEDVYVMQDGTGFLVRSYRTDWENIFYHDWEGNLKTQLTSFDYRVTGIERVDEEAGTVYFSATGPQSTDKHFYRVDLDGKNLVQITSGEGTHSLSISPKGSYFVDTWSSVASPGAIVVIDKTGKELREIYRPEAVQFNPAAHSRSELVRIKTADGLFEMPAIIKYPVNFDDTKKYPVVFTIYGGPDAGRVRNTWISPTPDFYSQNGIITISVDHRASGHFGKKGLDYMHRNLGKWEILDYADAVKWLRSKPWADGSRMGITGGSYGGYMTCLALTKGAEYWTHGVASSSVTDWKLYDNVYTERYMDEPKDNVAGYHDGSVLTFAGNLKGKLQIIHGDVDDNVHMQNSIQLISKLQDEGKFFEFMIYPGGRHGWSGAKRVHSTTLANMFWMREFFGK
ncbi:MAG: S9 family peptidase [Bacteroidales bacterium]|nr:S9 family peptidase [Bacteroidales bacterium]